MAPTGSRTSCNSSNFLARSYPTMVIKPGARPHCGMNALWALAASAHSAFIPQCGLGPGFITIVGYDLARKFDELQDVRLPVGAMPRYPLSALDYNPPWSTDGVINDT